MFRLGSSFEFSTHFNRLNIDLLYGGLWLQGGEKRPGKKKKKKGKK